jgi:dihydrofolate reductase
MKVTLQAFLTVDGVVQAPGGPDEDTEGGFEHGGWSFPLADAESGETILRWMGGAEAFLLGRRTYDISANYWPKITDPDHPIGSKLNGLPKYVASTTLRSAQWAHSSVLGPDVVADVRALREQPGGELQIHGSGGLAQTLMSHGLIDEFRLMFLPLHLGSGKKLFRDGLTPASLRLTSMTATGKGVLIATYEPAGPVEYGMFDLPE